MRFSSLFKRKDRAAPPARSPARASAAELGAVDSVQQARTRARHRLIGATVLVVIGIIGFPLLFETEPRPVPLDIPIEIARREAASAPKRLPSQPSAAPSRATRAAEADVITESAADAGVELPPAGKSPAPVARVEKAERDAAQELADKAAERAAEKAAERAAEKAERAAKAEKAEREKTERAEKVERAEKAERAAALAEKPPRPPAPADGTRAQLLLEGKSAAAAAAAADASARYVIQVGAFADPAAARETREKVERLGMKTYTQVAQTGAGNRTRVRVGPLASREEADRLQARLKAAGIAAVVLTL